MNDLLPLAQFSANAQQKHDSTYLHQPVNGELKSFTWGEVDQQARCIASALLSLGVSTGDRIGIMAKNCAKWFIADLAIMMAGLISVPIYHTANRKTIGYILEDSDCKAIFMGDLDGMEEAEAALNDSIPRITFSSPSLAGQYSWQDLLSYPPLQPIHQADEQDIMSIVYTSGSTGNPKGVVIEHQNLRAAALSAAKLLDVTNEQHLVSYLPLAHISERALIETFSFYVGCQVYFVETLESFTTDVKRCNPSSFISVPRLWNKFQSEILAKIPDKKLQIMLRIPFIGKLIAKKIRAGLGLSNTTIFGSGTAPISGSVLRWYERIGMPISEGWGMTETTGLSCGNMPFNSHSIGTIGRPLDCVEMKIGDNSEIMIRGEAVFKEYYKNPVATAKSFTDGWFHTGDMGEITEAGDFKIIGRVKEQFKTAKGKYVAPAPIENYLGRNNNIEQVCVMGEGRKQPIALVVLGPQSGQANSDIDNSLSKTLHIVNKKLEKHQKVDHIVVLKEQWTIENNLLTPTLKIKRSDIERKFQHYLEQDIPSPIYWEE